MMKNFLTELDNEPLSAITHFIGMLLSIAGLVLLVVYAAKYETARYVVGFSIFGATLILLYLASSWYHFVPVSARKWKSVMQKIDHSMIYAFIAGTYTPICIITLRGGWGWSLFGIIWALAAIGIVWKSLGRYNDLISTALYVIMGWLVVIAFVPLKNNLSHGGLGWLFAGGIAYTLGAVVYALEDHYPKRKWFNLHDLWHIFVLVGSFCHFAFFFWHVL